MNQEINPLDITKGLVDTFKRYLFSATPITDDEPELREEFRRQLEEYKFYSGPFIKYQPDYERSIHISELFSNNNDVNVHPDLRGCYCKNDLSNPQYKLYTHQAESIRKAQQQENVLIATGTGSGKTECFLLPILDDAIRYEGPGVRSIIIYPMNALANDQLERLRAMLAPFKNNEVTFGRYTGETPRNMSEFNEYYPDETPLECERVTREQIQEDPPKILITNFAMLEYLLIRPRDEQIFHHESLRYVVLDEAHTYRGAQGIEVALLMRRLRHAIGAESIQFFLTSATFTSEGKNSKKELADFATLLTGESFKPENILLGQEKNPLPEEVDDNLLLTRKLPEMMKKEGSLEEWLQILPDKDRMLEMLRQKDIVSDQYENTSDISRILYDLFYKNSLLKKIYNTISIESIGITELATQLFGFEDSSALRATQWLLIMGAKARSSSQAAPLLGSRIHLFFRGLQGACICLNPACGEKSAHPNTKWSAFRLGYLRECPECNAKMFPLEVCWHCGLPIIPLYILNGKWTPFPLTISNSRKIHITWSNQAELEMTDEEGIDDHSEYYWICYHCANIYEVETPQCDCGAETIRMVSIHNVDGYLERCPRCFGEAGVFDEVARAFITADDAPSAVIAETVTRSLPVNPKATGPSGGRNLLCFSDNRQGAAFFAPYLKRTTCISAYQQPLLEAIKEAVEDRGFACLSDIVDIYVMKAKKASHMVLLKNEGQENETYEIKQTNKAPSAAFRTLKKNCYLAIYQHICASPRQKNRFTGLGLATFYVELLEDEARALKKEIPQLFSGSEDENYAALQILLGIFLQRRAVMFEENIQPSQLGVQTKDTSFHLTQSNSRTGVSRWNPYHASRSRSLAIRRSRQLDLLCKWTGLNRETDWQELSDILDRIWSIITDEENPDDGMLVDAGNGRRKLNGQRILATIPEYWYQCEKCGILIPPHWNIKNLCPMPVCQGALILPDDDELSKKFKEHHERQRYSLPPLPLEVKEHTAQIRRKDSQRYQEDFIKGRINVLSCSTTFEMGVDVGKLKSVMMRNVPPSPSNYIQRAGRVGRRQEGMSFVATYARKSPHDQYFFGYPEKMISGQVNIPYLSLENDVLPQRHVNSFVLGKYLKETYSVHGKDSISIKEFFTDLSSDERGGKSLAEGFAPWMEDNRLELVNSIRRIIPRDSFLKVEDAFEDSKASLFEAEDSLFVENYLKTTMDYDRQINEINQKAETDETLDAAHKSSLFKIQARIEKYKKRFLDKKLLEFLRSCSWLPGYAFPQDTIELRVLDNKYADKMDLTRDRMIGIAEYSPGAEIIADGVMFKSRAIISRQVKYNEPLFEIKKYKTCKACRKIYRFPIQESNVPNICECGGGLSRARNYIIPEGFSTSATEPAEPPRFRRLRMPSNSEIFLVEGSGEDDFKNDKDLSWVSYALKNKAILFRANMGHKKGQFQICDKCGMALNDFRNNSHNTAWGNKCSGTVQHRQKVDLAHEFETDVLELRFEGAPRMEDKSFWESFLYAFLNGVKRSLNIESNDLAGLIHGVPDNSGRAELVIYDAVPGGAGYLKRIVENLKSCLEMTLDVVKNCPDESCDLSSSCYACLRSYNNQFVWDNLIRGRVSEWLEPRL